MIASAALLGLAPTAGVAIASTYSEVLQVYEREGSIPPCQFTAPQLQSALGGVDTYGAQYFADFTQAVQAALTSRAGGACAVVTSARRSAATASGSGPPVPPPPAGPLTAATSAGVPLPLAVLGGLALAGALALGGGASAAGIRRRRAQRVTGAPRL